VVGEPSANTLRRGHRGRVGILAEVHGRAAHASVGHRAINPHYPLAAFLCRLRDLPLRAQEPFGASSVAPTLYRTDSTSSNAIPSTAQVYLDWRNVPAESPEEALAALRPLLEETLPPGATGDVRIDVYDLTTYTGIQDAFPSIFPSFLLEEDHPLLLAARRTLEDMLGRPFPPGIWGFATDGGHLMAAGIPTIGFGPGDEAQAHVVDEHIEIAQMVEALAANAALVLALSAARA
jgi:acetylornithine deacetylase/succinyl-diaminopimelate desuccinylase-like protein